MKLLKRAVALLLTAALLPTFSVLSSAESVDVASGKELVADSGSYILDLGRAYPVDDVEISGVNTSSAKVMMSNDPEFPQAASYAATNVALNKPILSKLYGQGGYTSAYAVKYAIDGNSSTQFISTPDMSAVEWLTIDLEYPAVIESMSLNFDAKRTYTVAVTNTPHGQEEEFTDCVELVETYAGSKKFLLPDEYKDTSFRYARLRFAGDAPSNYYLDTNMYVYEFAVNGSFDTNSDVPVLTTTTLVKNNSVFTLNNAARDNYYRYLKVSGVSAKPTVKVNTQNVLADTVDITSDADVTIADDALVSGDFHLDRVTDGDYSTYTMLTYDAPYIQLDLHKKQAISHVEVYCRQDIANDRDNIKILLSNSADFDDYVILGEQFEKEETGLKAAFVKSKSNIFDCYRYVRVYEGSSFLVLSEIKVFAKEGYEDIYNVAKNVSPSADTNENVAYRATDEDAKSFWSGNTLTINLDRCYGVKALNLTASGNIKLTYGCDSGTNVSYTDAFADKETKNILFDGSVNVLNIESADGSAVKIYDVGVYTKNENEYINEIKPASVTSPTDDSDLIDLGRVVIIDHIEPCDITAEVSETEDFAVSNIVTGCRGSLVAARYVSVPAGVDVSVIGYDSPELVNAKEGRSVKFNTELYTNSSDPTAYVAVYDDTKALKSVNSDDALNGSVSVSGGEKASFMVWDNMMKPLLPKSETVYINKVPQAEFYVDPDVSVSGDGTEDAPFKTITEAQTAVRAINGAMTGDIVVNLKGGRYYLSSALTFSKSDGGTNGFKVIYKNAEGETPVITGGKKITGFKEDANGIWYAIASGFNSIYELMVNGEAATLARTEESINANSFDGTSGINFNKSDLPMITNPEDAFVHTAGSWMDVLLKVTGASQTSSLVKLTMDSRFANVTADGALSGHKITKNSEFYVENALELLDNPGEFYFNKDTKVLYYMPRSGENMATATVEGAVLERLVNIKGSNKYNHIENLTFTGIRFENSTFEKMYKYGLTTAQAQVVTFDKGTFVDGAIQIDYATNIEISDCEITGLTKPAISMTQGVLDSKISGNRFYNIGDSAVVVGEQNHYTISGTEELCERITISDNVVNKSGQKHRGAPGITCYYVADTEIVHNKITECNYTGISLGWGWSHFPDSTTCRRNRVANNYIENTNIITADGGGIYTLGQQPGTVIEGNYIVQNRMPELKSGFNAIYTDEGSSYITIRNNAIDIAGIKDYAGTLRDISMWIWTIKDNYAHDNYTTYTNVRNDGTNCVVDTPYIYVSGAEPNAVKKIIELSAKNL